MAVKTKNGVAKYSTAKGVRWKARYYKTDGKEGSKAGFLTEGAAKAFLRELETARVQGNFVDPARGRVTIAVVAEEWLEARRAATAARNGKRTTLSRVEGIVGKHILPTLGSVRVGGLTQADVGAWVSTLDGEAESVRKYVSVLRGIMKHAIKSKRITVNPVVDLTLPRIPKTQKRFLTHEQVSALYDAVNRTNDGESHGYGVLTLILAYCGLRWGELSGLRIEDIDLQERRIHVAHTIALVDGRQVEEVPKNYESREVPFPGFIATLLEKHIERRESELAADRKLVRAQLAKVTGREDEIAALHEKMVAMTEYISKVSAERAEIQSYLEQLHRDRDQRIAADKPYDEFDRFIEIANNRLARLPRPEILTARRDGIPAKIERVEKALAKAPREKEILEQQLAAIKQKPLFVGARTRIWLRNAQFRSGWLTPAVALMDAEAKQAALDAGERPPRPLGDVEPHELRHTCASLAVSAGANVKVVQRLLGHDKASVTLDTYSSLFETDLDDVANRMDEIVWSMGQDTDFSPHALEMRENAPDDDPFADVA